MRVIELLPNTSKVLLSTARTALTNLTSRPPDDTSGIHQYLTLVGVPLEEEDPWKSLEVDGRMLFGRMSSRSVPDTERVGGSKGQRRLEEGDRGGHGPKNKRRVIKDKENLTEITLIFVNISELRPFTSLLATPLDPEGNLNSIQRCSAYFTISTACLTRDFEVLTAELLRFLALLRSEAVSVGDWFH